MTKLFAGSRAVSAAALLFLWVGAPVFADDLASKKDASEEDSDSKGYFVPTITKFEGSFGALSQGWPSHPMGPQGGAVATVQIPFNAFYNAQFDTQASGAMGSWVLGETAHIYWADPKVGLSGAYGSIEYRNENGGQTLLQLGGEAIYYWNRFDLSAIVGAETQSDPLPPGVSTSGYDGSSGYDWGCNGNYGCSIGALTPGGGLYEMNGFRKHLFDQTRLFDHLEVAYFPLDDLRLSVAHEYTGGFNAVVADVEYLLRTGKGIAPSVFAEGSLGEHGASSILGGIRVYFGEEDKSLINRQREDDPTIHMRRDLISYTNLHSQPGQAMTPAPVPPGVTIPPPTR